MAPVERERDRERPAPFRALRVRNYRLFFIGQVLSIIGSWTQNIAVAWIVVRAAHSATSLGLIVALQFTPLLLLGAWAGAVADRADKRRLLQLANLASAAVALATALLVGAGHRSVLTLGVMSLLLGCSTAFETPARQSFAAELVPPADLSSAVGLNGAIMTGSRMIGSAVAGLLLVTLGPAVCLYVNAASFLAVIGALGLMRRAELREVARPPRAKGQVRAGLRYAAGQPEVRFPLAAMAVIGTLALNNQVTTPLLARVTFSAGPALFAAFGVVGGLGALCGAVTVASRRTATASVIGKAALGFGALTLGVACSPWAWLALVCMAGSSFGASLYISSTNARLQRVAADAYRGRVMALYAILFLGSTPVGSLIVSSLSAATNPRVGVGLGGVAAVLTGLAAMIRQRRVAPAAGGERAALVEAANAPAPAPAPAT